jgi:hypothetical protein
VKTPTILDANGHKLAVGDRVRYGGRVAAFIEPDESHWGVEVEWDDEFGQPGETFTTRPRDYLREGPDGPYVYVCDDVERSAPHDCWANPVPYVSDGPLGHGFECGTCGKFLQAG